MRADEVISHWLTEKLVIGSIVVVIVAVISVIGKRAKRKKLHNIARDKELMNELQQMRERGASYKQMSQFLISKGIKSHIADTVIARIEADNQKTEP